MYSWLYCWTCIVLWPLLDLDLVYMIELYGHEVMAIYSHVFMAILLNIYCYLAIVGYWFGLHDRASWPCSYGYIATHTWLYLCIFGVNVWAPHVTKTSMRCRILVPHLGGINSDIFLFLDTSRTLLEAEFFLFLVFLKWCKYISGHKAIHTWLSISLLGSHIYLAV